MGRDRKTTDILHARLATVSLRAFDRDTGTFTIAVTLCDEAGKPEADAEPTTVSFLASEYITARPTGIAEFEGFLRSARPGTLFTFAGRWITQSWVSRSGEIREAREFEATRMAEGWHDRTTLCGPLSSGPLSCPALAARQLLEAHLPAAARTQPGPPPCADPAPQSPAEPFPRREIRLSPTAAPSAAAAPQAWLPGRLLGIRPTPRILLSEPTPPPATLRLCDKASALPAGDRTPNVPAAQPCDNPACCPPPEA
jgi:hypothetical protein